MFSVFFFIYSKQARRVKIKRAGTVTLFRTTVLILIQREREKELITRVLVPGHTEPQW